MRKLTAPDYDVETVYQECINSIQNVDLSTRLNAITNEIIDAEENYNTHAQNSGLYLILPNDCNNNEIVVGTVTKKELKDVYSSHMVKNNKPARDIYDKLLSLAPRGKCPFCGLGLVSTLDHYLPKSKYPLIAVLPLNLIPSCRDCNTGKATKIARTAEEQCLHPYFDHQKFIDEQWLYAKVEETSPASIQFYIKPPEDWDEVSKERVKSHFKDFKLPERYAQEAGNELSSLRGLLTSYQELGSERVKEHLKMEAENQSNRHQNSWETAVFQALEASDWYCDGGYNS